MRSKGAESYIRLAKEIIAHYLAAQEMPQVAEGAAQEPELPVGEMDKSA